MKEGGGGDNLAVAYRLNNTTNPANGDGTYIIPGSVLSPFSGGSTPPSSGDGLNARYFNNMTLGGAPAVTRTDSTVNFAWSGSPATGVNADNFSVRWMGQLNPPTTGSYTFQVVADDGIRLWVDDVSRIDQWKDQAPTTYTSGTVNLTAGTRVDINVDFYENGGGAEARLRWQTPGSSSFVTIPQSALFTAGGNDPPAGPTPPPPATGSGPHQITTRYVGMNISGPHDSVRYPMYANVAKQCRYGTVDAPFDNTTAIRQGYLDRNGNPVRDFGVLLFDTNYGTLGKHGGTYTIRFNGQASLEGGGGTLSAVSYDSGSNTSSATFVLPADPSHPTLKFRNTKRTASSSTGTGITNLRIMRPVSPGSTTSYAENVVFTTEFISVMRQFHALRQMSNIEAGGNDWEDQWSERVLPSEPQGLDGLDGRSYGGNIREFHGRGESYEYMIIRANVSDTDLHITVPVPANDDYITKLAQLVRFGSDGVNPYTSAQSNPVYPPLEADRKLYVELGNELWNWGSPYWYNKNYMHTQAKATTASHPIRHDDQSLTLDENTLAYRWQAWRTVGISNSLRAVFGDAAMHTRVRTILGWQQGGGNATHGLVWAHRYYNNGDGRNNVSTPRPVNYYIWGGGGTFYNDSTPPNNPPSSLDEIFNNWDQNAWVARNLYTESTWAKSMGLAFYGYEGGPSLGGDTGGDIWTQAWFDTRMKREVVETMNAIEDAAADGGNWLAISGGDPSTGGTGATWTYVSNFWDPINTSPKMQGIDEINNTTTKRAPTVGVATGSAGFRAAMYARNNWWPEQHDTSAASINMNRQQEGYGYIVRASSSATHRLRVQHSGSATTVQVVANGVIAGTLNLPAAGSATWSTNVNVSLGSGANGVRLFNTGGSDVTLYNIVVEP